MDERFTDRVAVVTGASSGIGQAVAERLAAEGASVVACARHEPEQEMGAGITFVTGIQARCAGPAVEAGKCGRVRPGRRIYCDALKLV